MNDFISNSNYQQLSPSEKRELLAKLLQQKADSSSSFAPLSYMQQGLWSLYQLAPQSWAYNVLFSAKIVSPIDISTFKKSWQILVDRHDSLRSNYTIKNGMPVRQIYSQQQFHLAGLKQKSSPN
jgi:Condensation domain